MSVVADLYAVLACMLILLLLMAAVSGLTLGQLWRMCYRANLRFIRGERDWASHGDEDKDRRSS